MQSAKKIDAQRALELFSKNGPAKCRAARAWLRWNLDETAEKAGLVRTYLTYYENGRYIFSPDECLKLYQAFLNAGLEVTHDGVSSL